MDREKYDQKRATDSEHVDDHSANCGITETNATALPVEDPLQKAQTYLARKNIFDLFQVLVSMIFLVVLHGC